jgi:hypothetical protein
MLSETIPMTVGSSIIYLPFRGFRQLITHSLALEPSHSGITVSPGMEEMPSLNMSVHMLKLATLPLDLPCSGPVTHSGEILTTGKSHRKKPDRRGFWTRETGTGQHVAQLHDRYMMMMMMIIGPSFNFYVHEPRGKFRPRQTRQLPRAVDLKGRLLSCQSY